MNHPAVDCSFRAFVFSFVTSRTVFLISRLIVLFSSQCCAHFPFTFKAVFKMPSIIRLLYAASAVVAVVHAQGVVQSAQGTKGSPASPPLQINLKATDANIINNDEITANIVNECGRTLLAGNIDVGANTEDQLANKTVTSVTKGSTVAVTIKQGGTDGAGPYTCDMDLTSNSNGVTGQTALTVKETDAKDGTISLSVTMPADMACVGGMSQSPPPIHSYLHIMRKKG